MWRLLQSGSARSLLVFGSRSHAGENRRASSYQWNQGWGTPGYESCVVSFTPIAYSFFASPCPITSFLHPIEAFFIYTGADTSSISASTTPTNITPTTSLRELAVAYFTTDAYFFSRSSFPLEDPGMGRPIHFIVMPHYTFIPSAHSSCRTIFFSFSYVGFFSFYLLTPPSNPLL